MDPINIFTIILGFLTLGIAYQQWITNYNKLMLDLFDKRFKVFTDMEETLSKISSLKWGGDEQSLQVHMKPYIVNTHVGEFMFDGEAREFIREFYDKALMLYGQRMLIQWDEEEVLENPEKLKDPEKVKEYEKVRDKAKKLTEWFTEQDEEKEYVELFRRYLSIETKTKEMNRKVLISILIASILGVVVYHMINFLL